MCLKVATKKMVAKTDLVVFKCLDSDKLRRKFCTPFQYLPIKFDNDGKCVIKSGDNALIIEKKMDSSNEMIDIINIGVHAFTTKLESDFVARHFPWSNTNTYYAVIPKGCPYYIGLNFDIVTTEMIVFRSKRSYDKYTKEHEIKEV